MDHLNLNIAVNPSMWSNYLRLNCSFNPLTFTKLRFWPRKKKLQNGPLYFAYVTVLSQISSFFFRNPENEEINTMVQCEYQNEMNYDKNKTNWDKQTYIRYY